MNPKDIKTPADVAEWLRHHVEWNDIASEEMMLRAVQVLEADIAVRACAGGPPRHGKPVRAKGQR